ncbi:hypothetical protein D9M68_851940 [compost metagenome]
MAVQIEPPNNQFGKPTFVLGLGVPFGVLDKPLANQGLEAESLGLGFEPASEALVLYRLYID